MSLEQLAAQNFVSQVKAIPPYYQNELLGSTYNKMLEDAQTEAIKDLYRSLKTLIPDMVRSSVEDRENGTGFSAYYYKTKKEPTEVVNLCSEISDLIMQEIDDKLVYHRENCAADHVNFDMNDSGVDSGDDSSNSDYFSEDSFG